MTSISKFCFAAASLPLLMISARAQTSAIIWANNASLGSPHLQAFDTGTGAAIADFPAPNPDAQKGNANGRGIAVVGTAIYYTLANTGSVYVTDTITHADGGVAFNTGLPGIAGLSWDGAALWVLPYVNLDINVPSSQSVYCYSLGGNLLKTVQLAPPVFPNPPAPRDGFVATPTGFVTDRGASVPYDLFDLSGNLVTPYFITSPLRSTGVAFDGQQYVVSDLVTKQISRYDSNGLFFSTTSLTGATIPFGLEGLSLVAPAPAALATLSLSPGTATGGGLPVVGMVTLNAPAPAGNANVIITSSNPALASVPGSIVTILAGFGRATFPVNTGAVLAPTTITLSAAYNGNTVSANLNLIPSFALAPITLAASSVVGGTFTVGTVHLTSPSDGSALVTLSTSDPLLAQVSASVLVPKGLTSAGFTIKTFPVSGTVNILASMSGITQSAPLTVTAPAPPAPATLTGLSFTPATAVGGGTPVVGLVTLSAPAPAGNAAVLISSGNPALASAPASTVTIAAGSSSATFPVSTAAVATATTVFFSASYNGIAAHANIVLVPSFSLASVTLNPASLVSGNSSAGTVTLTSPSDGSALVTLSSSNPQLAKVSAAVLVPAGLTSVGFAIGIQTGSGTAIISATFGGVTRNATLTVVPPPPAGDTVKITKVEYAINAQQLKIEAASTNAQATLAVSVTSSGQILGTLSNAGAGKYTGQFIVPVNPQNVTVTSSAGGTASSPVTAK